MATTKRPCCVCRRWFAPDPRVGKRQKACSRDECQRERHRQNCAQWREREREGERDLLLARVVVTLDPKGPTGRPLEVHSHDPQDEMRSKVEVEVRKLAQLISRPARDESAVKRSVKGHKVHEVVPAT